MDFHSLSRRELQYLCKKNKIQANMTNVAMADALKLLKHVEGLDEILNQTESKTPAAPSQRRAPESSFRRKIENQKDEGSMQRVHGARRSVRLLEKRMFGLSLKDKGRLEPIKMIFEDEENEMKKESSSEEIDGGVENPDQICNGLIADGREFKDVIEYDNKNNDSGSDAKTNYQDETYFLLEENGEDTADKSDESIQEKDIVTSPLVYEGETIASTIAILPKMEEEYDSEGTSLQRFAHRISLPAPFSSPNMLSPRRKIPTCPMIQDLADNKENNTDFTYYLEIKRDKKKKKMKKKKKKNVKCDEQQDDEKKSRIALQELAENCISDAKAYGDVK